MQRSQRIETSKCYARYSVLNRNILADDAHPEITYKVVNHEIVFNHKYSLAPTCSSYYDSQIISKALPTKGLIELNSFSSLFPQSSTLSFDII
jgi:hypothetical protein